MGTRAAAEQITTATSFMLFRVGDAARDLITRTLAQQGLSGRELLVLSFAVDEALSQQELCQLTGMDRTTMVAVIDTLEELGHAQRRRSTADRRKQLISATAKGIRAFRAAMRKLETIEQEFLAPLDAGEQRQLQALIARLYAAHDPTCLRPAPETAESAAAAPPAKAPQRQPAKAR